MLKYLLDTNIISEPIRLIPNQYVIEKINLYRLEIAVSTVTIQELLYGLWRLAESRKCQVLDRYINQSVLSLPILDYDLKSAQYHAQERARLSKMGKTPPFIDSQFTSIAVTNDLILVTHNVENFRDFNDLIIDKFSSN